MPPNAPNLAPLVSPMLLLLIVLGITGAAWLAHRIARRRVQRSLEELARGWRMHYSPHDVFNLAPRIAPKLPTPGAADVRVHDLIYGSDPDAHRYIFCAEYTVGVVRARGRERRVVCILEPRGHSESVSWSSLQIAPEGLPLIEQYKALQPNALP